MELDKYLSIITINEDSDMVTRMNLRQRPQRKPSEIVFDDDSLKFMEDFDPENSNREKRKLKKKVNNSSKMAVYDEYGHIRHSGVDVCDCMSENCSGCWYECKNCGSTKCGLQCRVNRRFYYESITFDGKDQLIVNSQFRSK